MMDTSLSLWQKHSIAVVGTRGVLIGLDTIPAVCRVRIYEYGNSLYSMSPGSAVVMIWGGSVKQCLDIETRLIDEGYNVTFVHHKATRIDRLHRKLKYWRMSILWALQKVSSKS